MFYSESLLAKTGPLARVWLAANLEKKLTKQNVLSSNLENNVKDIIGQGQAPMALRLSGQLLLGVVKIYSRKARYLLDDCSDALHKIKVAFRPGNVDLPSNQTHAANPNALVLPDALTEVDLFAPLPDPDDFLREDNDRRGPGKDPTLLDFGTSQLLEDSQPAARDNRALAFDDDLDLGINFGLDPGEEAVRSTPASEGRSVEVGRRAETPRRDEPSFLNDDDLGINFGIEGDTTLGKEGSVQPPLAQEDMPMPDLNDDMEPAPMDDDVARANEDAFERAQAAAERRRHGSASPLSTIRPSVERDLENDFELTQLSNMQDETEVQAAQRVKRRKVMPQDSETQLHNAQIKRQQEDRSAITKAPSFLPHDPLLLQLMEMQRNGSFVSNLMGDGRMAGWAPELRGIMSLEVVKKAGEKKRKRDSGVADLETDGDRLETPQLDIPQDEDEGFQPGAVADFGGDTTLRSARREPMSDGLARLEDQQADFEAEDLPPMSPGVAFDTTEAPLLHPSQTGPVSLGTKNAVHLLRQHFAPTHPTSATEPPTPSKRVKAEANFTDLCPEKTTSRQDATKMFFELLVLGTKDAVKVEQEKGEGVGGAIKVRGKRGLWGDWAAREAGGEIEAQESAALEQEA